MPLLRKKSIIGAKFETTEGTAETLGATDFKFLVYDVAFKPEVTLIPRDFLGPSYARKTSLVTIKLARITFKTYVVGSDGAVDTAPAWATLLKACGFKETITASTKVDWDPVVPLNLSYDATGANGNVSLTMAVNEDGLQKTARGCRGTVRFVGEAASVASAEWEFLGIYNSTVDAAYPALDAGADNKIPPLIESAAFTFHELASGVSIIRSFTLDMGNVIVPRFDASSAAGIKSIIIPDREVTATIDPEEEKESVLTTSYVDRLMAGTAGAFSIVLGTTAGNRITLAAPAAKVQITDASEADRDNLISQNINLAFFVPDTESATDKEIRVTSS